MTLTLTWVVAGAQVRHNTLSRYMGSGSKVGRSVKHQTVVKSVSENMEVAPGQQHQQ